MSLAQIERKRERDRENSQRWRDQHRAEIRAFVRSPEGRARRRAYMERYRTRHPERYKEMSWRSRLKFEFGITPDQYRERLAAQAEVCAICRRPDPMGRRLAIDHDHRTGVIRGLLCIHCNQGIGLFGDDPELFLRILDYLGRKDK